ncbi:MAG TPA: hypothetical protein PLJ27_10635 [Polyangiaceae bacterium]|jgi:hypothetical protein|nr:MAG: hypothetical protein BWY17_03336 [Deltaproteobacteria bacterium ADurb.Bin207]HNS96908.1 hypothetical protein [Polyangiaceae bacterium]HNZ21062.1 hypothetical protein [Polyangiaceae bacterium]HOD22313.1 hypothetical protein [Polyangiaceae bacterium]HOE47832.1 hypothetical protein [Polyangiaceae bacterium]
MIDGVVARKNGKLTLFAKVGQRMGVVACVLMALGCTDDAEQDFKRCEQLDKERKYEEALLACQEAQKKDSRSPFGQKAISLESKLHDKISALAQEKAAAAKESEEADALETANAKVVFNQVSTPPNDPQGYSERCMARNRAYENSYHCEPKDPSSVREGDAFPFKEECMLIAKNRGCMPFYEDSPTKLFCCTK